MPALNPYSFLGGLNYYPMPQPYSYQSVPQNQIPQYMINVDGENSAKAWQPSVIPQPNTIIPLFDSDGQHVYFKTYDAYGRMNPIRKGRIVFDDEIQVSESTPSFDMSAYATKDDLDKLRDEILSQVNKTNQNGTSSRGGERK